MKSNHCKPYIILKVCSIHVFGDGGPRRRTSMRFYSTTGDLFHAVEVPLSRGAVERQHGSVSSEVFKGPGLMLAPDEAEP